MMAGALFIMRLVTDTRMYWRCCLLRIVRVRGSTFLVASAREVSTILTVCEGVRVNSERVAIALGRRTARISARGERDPER